MLESVFFCLLDQDASVVLGPVRGVCSAWVWCSDFLEEFGGLNPQNMPFLIRGLLAVEKILGSARMAVEFGVMTGAAQALCCDWGAMG